MSSGRLIASGSNRALAMEEIANSDRHFGCVRLATCPEAGLKEAVDASTPDSQRNDEGDYADRHSDGNPPGKPDLFLGHRWKKANGRRRSEIRPRAP
jgi:hypothetical protein